MPYANFLSYKKGENNLSEIVPEEAEIIRRIFREFLEGKTAYTIAEGLTKDGIKTPRKNKVWKVSTIESILSNEKYKGSALLQKSFTVDYLTKRKKKNEGEVKQYYIEESHPPIIDPYEFSLAQSERERRRNNGKVYSGNNIFGVKIVCEDCGGFYGSKVWHSTDKYKKVIYRCNFKYKNKEHCKTPTVTEEKIKDGFVKAYNELIDNKNQVLDDCREI